MHNSFAYICEVASLTLQNKGDFRVLDPLCTLSLEPPLYCGHLGSDHKCPDYQGVSPDFTGHYI